MNYYSVRVGRNPGIYRTWDECKNETQGFPKAEFKKFGTKEEALAFLNNKKDVDEKEAYHENLPKEGEVYAYVDGSFRIQDFSYSYGIVFLTVDGEEHFKKEFPEDEFSSMRNVAGEINGSMEAIRVAIERGFKKIVIFYDYMGIEKWAVDEWKANKKGTVEYKKFIDESRAKIDIEFVKVDAHTGNKYNELADELAKEALGIKK